MVDEPLSPQKLIDDAAKELEKLPVPKTPELLTKEEPPVVEDIQSPPVMSMSIVEEKPTETKPIDVPSIPIVETPPPSPIPEPMIVVEKPEEKKEEPMIIPSKEKEDDRSLPPPLKPEKKKSGKGLLIATLLFFIFTLPIALYYITQSPQFAEIRSRAAGGTCSRKPFVTNQVLCASTDCEGAKTQSTCNSMCCTWKTATATPIPTLKPTTTSTPIVIPGAKCPNGATAPDGDVCSCPTPPSSCKTVTPTKKPVSSGCTYQSGMSTVLSCRNLSATGCSGISENACKINCTCCSWNGSKSCGGGGTSNETGGGTGGRTAEGTFHNCGYLNNTGSSGPAQSSCDSTNCGNKPCGVFTFKCGKYCLDTSCGKAACYDDPPKTPTPTLGPTATVTPTAEPTNPPAQLGQCDASCDSDSNCESGLSCVTANGVKRCRKAACSDRSDCTCLAATLIPTNPAVYNTPIPTRVRLIAEVTEMPTSTPTNQPTPKIPVAGVGPGIFGAISVAGSILLLLVGLIL